MAAKDCLDERTRAGDIILGALGYDCDATIVAVEPTAEGFKGRARWSDGELFEFESDDEVSDLERWAIEVLTLKTES